MNGCSADGIAEANWRRENEKTMKPPENSRLADEKAAIDLQRKKPKTVSGVPTKRM